MSARKVLFWLHLSAGVVAGAVIFIMCITGVLLAYERQIVEFADRGFRHGPPSAESQPLQPESLLSRIPAERLPSLSTFTLRAEAEAPAEAAFGRGAPPLYIDRWNGRILGEGSAGVRGFFRATEDWHRWLAAGLETRPTARLVTGIANFVFFGLAISGLILWMPRQWTWRHIRPALWFRRGLRGRARDWNWHNAAGVWCCIPLAAITLTGIVMSFSWANNLVYRVTGSELPAARQEGGGRPDNRGGRRATAPRLDGLNQPWSRAIVQVPNWKSIAMRMPASNQAPVTFQIDAGSGRPDLRSQVTVDRATGQVIRFEPFSSQSAGRRLRSWIRFTHTGEAGGFAGETIAMIATAGGCLLVITGISLAIRRLLSRLNRQKEYLAEKQNLEPA